MSKWAAKRYDSYRAPDEEFDDDLAKLSDKPQVDTDIDQLRDASYEGIRNDVGMDDEGMDNDVWEDEGLLSTTDEVDEVFVEPLRTWQDRNVKNLENWDAIIPSLAMGLAMGSGYVRACTCDTKRRVLVIRMESCVWRDIDFCRCSWAASFTAQGLFPGTPRLPQIAFDVHTLSVFQFAMNRGHMSKEAFAYGWKDKLQMFSREPIPDFYDQWRAALKHLTRVWNMAYQISETPLALNDVCPCCFAEESGSVMLCVDGNFQHKRFQSRSSKAAAHNAIDRRIFLPNASPPQREARSRGWIRVGCGTSFKADQQRGGKGKNFDESGVMVVVCRHDIPLRAMNIIRSGESYFYPLELLKSVLDDPSCPLKVVVAYDVACKFQAFAQTRLATNLYRRLEFVVPAFHITTHEFSCHLQYHPRCNKHVGLSDGEGCERVWSNIRHLVTSGRYSEPFVRQQQLSNALLHLGERKRQSLWRWFDIMDKHAISTLNSSTEDLAHILNHNHVIGGHEILITKSFLAEQFEMAKVYYTSPRWKPTSLARPEHKEIYDLIEARQNGNISTMNHERIAFLLRSSEMTSIEWEHGAGSKWKQCHEAVLLFDALKLQSHLWKDLSKRNMANAVLRGSTSGTRSSRQQVRSLTQLGKKANADCEAYNKIVGKLHDIGDTTLRIINLRDPSALEIDSPIWDLTRALPGMSWALNGKVFAWMKSSDYQGAAEREITRISAERVSYSRWISEKLTSLEIAVSRCCANDVSLSELLVCQKMQFQRLYNRDIPRAEDSREVFLTTALRSIALGDDDTDFDEEGEEEEQGGEEEENFVVGEDGE